MRSGAKFCQVCGAPAAATPVLMSQAAAIVAGDPGAFLLLQHGQKVFLESRTLLIGRSTDCDISLPDDSVSARHAEIKPLGNTYTLQDLGSRNGTWVNRQRISGILTLNSGDEIAFGEVVCAFQCLEGVTPVAGGKPANMAVTYANYPGLPATLPGPSPLLSPAQEDIQTRLRQWDPPPQAEGRVVDVQGPVMEKKGDIGGKVAMAVGLALIAAPLAWLPFAADRNEVAVRYLRVEDLHTGHVVSVKMIGDPSGTIAVGDTIAIWGAEHAGNLFMRAAFNYTTNAEVRLRA